MSSVSILEIETFIYEINELRLFFVKNALYCNSLQIHTDPNDGNLH